LYDANGSSVGVSDNWKNPDRANIERTKAAPTNDKEAAILMLLQPGNYTAVVRGANATIGTALVEFYAL
jgi:hypothetical protein